MGSRSIVAYRVPEKITGNLETLAPSLFESVTERTTWSPRTGDDRPLYVPHYSHNGAGRLAPMITAESPLGATDGALPAFMRHFVDAISRSGNSITYEALNHVLPDSTDGIGVFDHPDDPPSGRSMVEPTAHEIPMPLDGIVGHRTDRVLFGTGDVDVPAPGLTNYERREGVIDYLHHEALYVVEGVAPIADRFRDVIPGAYGWVDDWSVTQYATVWFKQMAKPPWPTHTGALIEVPHLDGIGPDFHDAMGAADMWYCEREGIDPDDTDTSLMELMTEPGFEWFSEATFDRLLDRTYEKWVPGFSQYGTPDSLGVTEATATTPTPTPTTDD